MEKCFKAGLQPAAAAQILAKKGIKDLAAAEAAINEIAADSSLKAEALSTWPIESSLPKEAGIFSSAVPPKPVFAEAGAFGNGDAGQVWVKRQALAYTIGMCPIFALLAPEVTIDKVVELVQMSAEWDEFSKDTLEILLHPYYNPYCAKKSSLVKLADCDPESLRDYGKTKNIKYFWLDLMENLYGS